MNEKEMNTAIFNKMLENAQDTFNNHGECRVGTYTIADLQKRDVFFYGDDANTTVYRIEVGAFSCQYTARNAFELCQYFARLAGAKCPVFTKEETAAPVCTFTMDVPKGARHLADFADKDKNWRPCLCNVFVDVNNSTLCASNNHVLKTMHVKIGDLTGEVANSDYVCITPKDIKKLHGVCVVKVYIDRGFITTEITDARGVKYASNAINNLYPNYKGVYPKVCRKGHITIARDQIKDFAKSLKKSDATTLLKIESGSDFATVSTDGNERTLRLTEKAQANAVFAFKKRCARKVREKRVERRHLVQ